MPDLLGRDSELATIERFVGSTSREALLLDGPAGIGKTSLWLEGVRLAQERGRRVLLSRPASDETRLSFAGVSDLLAPALDDVLPGLPTPQARALEAALLLSDPAGEAPDERAVYAAFAGALAQLASTASLLLGVDDVQWLDAPSASALAFAFARVGVDRPVGLLIARRSDGAQPPPLGLARTPDAAPLTHIAVGRLSLGALSRLLRERLGSAPPRPAMLRIDELSAGNPFFALELGRSLAAADGRPPAVPPTLAELLTARLDRLPARTRQTLLLVAAAGKTTLETLERAGAADPEARLRPALAAGVVEIAAGTVGFSHPLLGEAMYAEADPGRRRRAHEALAEASDDLEERARHLARALAHPDAAAAGTLEEAARQTRQRGARSVSAELYEAAARLTPPPDATDRARRLLQAANALYEAGDSGRAQTMLEALVTELGDGPERTEAMWRLGVVLDETGSWPEAMRIWQDALTTATEQRLVAEIRRSMAVTTAYTGSMADAIRHADAALAAAERSGGDQERAYAAAARAYVAVLAGDPSYRQFVEQALALEPRELLGEWSPSATAAECARLAHDLPDAKQRFEELLRRAIDSGDANVEQWASFGLADVEVELGDFERADGLADSVLELAEQTGVMRMPGLRLRALVDTVLGRVDAARAAAAESLAEAQRADEKLHEGGARTVLGFLALSEGDAGAAADHLREARRIAEEIGIAVARYLRPYLDEAEAAAAAGRADQAEEALAAFEARASDVPVWLAPIVARARTAAGGARESAVAELETALATPSLEELPFERARTLLALGVARRRALQRGAARSTLEEAAATFEQLGAPLWAARARDELARVGGRARGDALTTAERRIAELAAEGCSNKEIAAALFLTVSTVEATLSRVYRKLGIRSRAALGRALAGQSVGESALSAGSERA